MGHIVIHLIRCDFSQAKVPSIAHLDITNEFLKVYGKADAMKGFEKRFGSRLRYARKKWHLTQPELADRAAVGVATVRRAENGYFEPRLESARRLADALDVRLEWLLTGDSDTMVLSVHLTIEEQMKSRPPAGSGHPDTVLIVGPGPWFMDDDEEWQVDGAAERKEEG